MPQPPDCQSPVSRVEAVPFSPLHRRLIHYIDLPVCFSDILPHSQFVSFIFEVRPPLRAFVCLLNIPTYLSFAIRFPMSPGLLPRFAHHPYPCLLFICRLTIYLPLACRTAHLLPRPWYRARPFAVTLLLRRFPCVFTSFPPSSTRSPSCLPHRPAALGCFYLLPLLTGAILVRARSACFVA